MGNGFGEASLSKKDSSKHSSLIPASDCEKVHQQLVTHFEEFIDPRGSQGVLHPFMSIVMIVMIVMIALLATIGGASAWQDIQTYGQSKS